MRSITIFAVYSFLIALSLGGCFPSHECANSYDAEDQSYSSLRRCWEYDEAEGSITLHYHYFDGLDCKYNNSKSGSDYDCNQLDDDCEDYAKYRIYFGCNDIDGGAVSWQEEIVALGCDPFYNTDNSMLSAYTFCDEDTIHIIEYFGFPRCANDGTHYYIPPGCTEHDQYYIIQNCPYTKFTTSTTSSATATSTTSSAATTSTTSSATTTSTTTPTGSTTTSTGSTTTSTTTSTTSSAFKLNVKNIVFVTAVVFSISRY